MSRNGLNEFLPSDEHHWNACEFTWVAHIYKCVRVCVCVCVCVRVCVCVCVHFVQDVFL